MLAIYRFGSYVPAPGVNSDALSEALKNQGGIFGLLSVFSGGGLARLGVFALGIMPYITASIILQVMTPVFPSLQALQKEGELGQRRITQYTRYLTVLLASLQALGYTYAFHSNALGSAAHSHSNASRQSHFRSQCRSVGRAQSTLPWQPFADVPVQLG
jgi:preprotein translocase subunit SecY